jgi:hypothetical protein
MIALLRKDKAIITKGNIAIVSPMVLHPENP